MQASLTASTGPHNHTLNLSSTHARSSILLICAGRWEGRAFSVRRVRAGVKVDIRAGMKEE
jgi:hypothetical protein